VDRSGWLLEEATFRHGSEIGRGQHGQPTDNSQLGSTRWPLSEADREACPTDTDPFAHFSAITPCKSITLIPVVLARDDTRAVSSLVEKVVEPPSNLS